MSTQARPGIRAARALLGLLEEHSAEELEAAESILSGEKELTNILHLLRKFKEHEPQPLSIERLREIVRREILDLGLSPKEMVDVAVVVLDDGGMRLPSRFSVEDVLGRVLATIEGRSHTPGSQVDSLIELLVVGAGRAGPEHVHKVAALLRDLAAQSLAENLVMFPTLHSLAQLRTRWAEEPLSYQAHESRQRLATRLLMDVARLSTESSRGVTTELLRQGMRGPADEAIAAVRRMKSKKAHGE